MIPPLTQTVTWIKVEKPTFDLVGLVLGSFAATGILVLVALILGAALGIFLIRKRGRRPPSAGSGSTELHLRASAPGH